MAGPTYTTDLVDISLCDALGTWVEPGTWTYGAGPGYDTENYIQGTGAISKAFNATGAGGMIFDYGSGVTITSPAAVFIWLYWASPKTLDIESNGGMRVMVGSGSGAFKGWKVGGKDTYIYGGWINVAVDPSVTADYTVGSPTTTKQWFGGAYNNLDAISKGNPCLVDAVRAGRELRLVGGDSVDGYATFSGVAAKNDANDATNGYNRWGLFQAIDAGYIMKGLFLMGNATTAVDFRDANRNIVIQNTKKVASTFNAFEIRNASSRVDWTNINITSLGTTSRGDFITTDNATVNKYGCSFTDMGTFGYLGNGSIYNTVYRRCGLITQQAALFNGCTIDSTTDSVKAMLVKNPSRVVNCIFVSTGTGHAMEFTTNCAGNSYNLIGCTFTNYATSDGTTGNEVIYNNSGGAVTINASGNTGTLSVRNGTGASTNIVSGSVSVTVVASLADGTRVAYGNVFLYADGDFDGCLPSNVQVTITNSGTTATVSHTAHNMLTNDKVFIKGASLQANNGVFTITKINDNSYSYTMSSTPGSDPTGEILATFVVLYGLTTSTGVMTMSRVFGVNQPVLGWVRKANNDPPLKTAQLSGEIDTTTGATLSAILLPDA